MNPCNTLGRIRTCRHIRSARSIRTSTGSGLSIWPRLRETEHLRLLGRRFRAKRMGHKQPRMIAGLGSF